MADDVEDSVNVPGMAGDAEDGVNVPGMADDVEDSVNIPGMADDAEDSVNVPGMADDAEDSVNVLGMEKNMLTAQKIMEKEGVIFDLDGTLVDSMWVWKQIDIDYLDKYNISHPKDLQEKISGMSFCETAVYFKQRFAIPDSVEEMMETWNRMAFDSYQNKVKEKPGALAFLQWLKEQGIKTGIATSNSEVLVEAVLKARGLDGYFQAVHTGYEVERGKPAPDIYLLVAKSLGVPPEKCLAFEDIPEGILAADAAGMEVCAVEDGFSAHLRQQKQELARYYINDYRDIFASETFYYRNEEMRENESENEGKLRVHHL